MPTNCYEIRSSKQQAAGPPATLIIKAILQSLRRLAPWEYLKSQAECALGLRPVSFFLDPRLTIRGTGHYSQSAKAINAIFQFCFIFLSFLT